jgi:sugar (pentulose or hexulose) kinase
MPNTEPLVFSFDFGTQSVRAMLVDKDGKIVSLVREKYNPPYYSKKIGYAEQSFDTYYKYACIAAKSLKEKNKKLFDQIICVTITTIRDTFTCTDEKGKPIRDFILWLDQRRATHHEKMTLYKRILFKAVSMDYALERQREICRPAWIKENEPDIWENTKKFSNISAILNAKLTGNYVDCNASCIGHVPFNYKTRNWMKENELTYPLFELEPDKFIKIVTPTSQIGKITKEAGNETGLKEGLPVIASGSDKGCETIGSGVMNNYSAALSMGTSATIQFATRKYVEPAKFLPAYPSPNPDFYNPELQVMRAGWMFSWFIENFGFEDKLIAEKEGVSPEHVINRQLDKVPLGSGGLLLLPYWNAPLKQPEARGTILGFMPDHNKYYIYRAIIEGVVFTLYQGFQTLEKNSKHHTRYLVISGGSSVSETICQIVADIFNLPVKRSRESEACGLGSAMCGFVGMGVYKSFDEAAKNMVHYSKTYEPIKENHLEYEEIYRKKFVKLYPSIRGVYRNYIK